MVLVSKKWNLSNHIINKIINFIANRRGLNIDKKQWGSHEFIINIRQLEWSLLLKWRFIYKWVFIAIARNKYR